MVGGGRRPGRYGVFCMGKGLLFWSWSRLGNGYAAASPALLRINGKTTRPLPPPSLSQLVSLDAVGSQLPQKLTCQPLAQLQP
jgi:hypothetical protein